MATFVERVTALFKAPASNTECGTWLTNGAADVIRRVSVVCPQYMPSFATQVSVTSTGADITGVHSVLDVTRGNFTAKQIPVELRNKAALSTSLYYATDRTPSWYALNGYLKVLPTPTATTGAYASIVDLPTVSATASTITGFGSMFYDSVVVYAAIQNALAYMGDAAMPVDAVLPSPPTIGAFTSITATLPTYTAPTAPTLPAPPTGMAVDMSDVGSIPVFVEPATMSLPAMGALPASPVYTAPTLTMTSTATLTELVVPPPPTLEEATDSDAPTAPAEAVLSSSGITITLPTAPTYTPPLNDAYSAAMTLASTHVDTNEDPELAQTKIGQINQSVSQYQADIQNAVAKFNRDNAVFQADLQRQIEQLRVGSESQGLEARIRLERYQAQVQAYVSRVNVAALNNKSKLDAYQSELNGSLQKWQLEQLQGLQGKWIATRSSEVGKFQADIESAANELASKTSDFQANVQKVLQSYQIGSSNELNRYTNELQTNAKEFDSELAVWVKQVDTALDTFEKETGYEVAVYRAQVEAIVAKYRADVDAAVALVTTNANIYAIDIQHVDELNKRVLGQYVADVNKYQVELTGTIQNFTAKVAKKQAEYVWYLEEHDRLVRMYEAGFAAYAPQQRARQ